MLQIFSLYRTGSNVMEYKIILENLEKTRVDRAYKNDETIYKRNLMSKEEYLVYLILKGVTQYEKENNLPTPSFYLMQGKNPEDFIK